jgi:hypothetical protein
VLTGTQGGRNSKLPHLKGLQDGDIATSKIKQVCSTHAVASKPRSGDATAHSVRGSAHASLSCIAPMHAAPRTAPAEPLELLQQFSFMRSHTPGRALGIRGFVTMRVVATGGEWTLWRDAAFLGELRPAGNQDRAGGQAW